ncbi:MAG: extracellular solute-binding protein [Alphaproteobacteria bacterium]|nr:extracellular solute-binding protein [Alphaproteobacteria bacterium]
MIRALCLALVLSAAAAARDLPAKVAALIPAAEKEGNVIVWGTTLNPRQVRLFDESFNAFYGTKIKVEMPGGQHTAKAAEVIMAIKSGVPPGMDLFWTGAAAELIPPGAVQKVNWVEELGVRPELQLGEYGIRTHDGHPAVLTYNTRLVKPEDLPKSYLDLLDPKWKGKIAMPRTSAPWVFLSYALGEEQTAELLTKVVSTQNTKMLSRYADIRARVIGGEFPISIGTDAWTQIQQGAPVAHVDIGMVIAQPTGAYLMVGAEHVAAAKLWGYWAISPEGQKVLEAARAYSLIDNLESAQGKWAQNKRIVYVPFDWRMEHYNRLQDRFQNIMDGSASNTGGLNAPKP